MSAPNPAPKSYEDWVHRAQFGTDEEREEAFTGLMRQFMFAAQSWAYQFLGDTASSQDAAQDAFIIAYEKIADLRDASAFPSWLRRIVRTQCIRQLRRQRDEQSLEETRSSGDDLASLVEQRMLHYRLRTAVDNLPEHERIVTELFYISGYSQQEIAEKLGLPLTTVKKRLQYAREHLREALPAIQMRLSLAA